MAVNKPDIYQHNNPDLAFVDGDFIKGGFRTAVGDVSELYALSAKTGTEFAPGQLKEYATIVYVSGETKYYILKDINNVSNSNGWEEFVTGGGAGTITGATNVGSGTTIFSGTSGQTLVFNTIVGSGNTNVTKIGNEIVISNSSPYTAGDGITIVSNEISLNNGIITSGTILKDAANETHLYLTPNQLVQQVNSQGSPGFIEVTSDGADNSEVRLCAGNSGSLFGVKLDELGLTYEEGPDYSTYIDDSFITKGYADQYYALADPLTETVSRTIYIAPPPTGDDVIGTGLIGAPFATPLRAFQDIKSILNESVIITIDVSAGVYDIDMILTDLYTSKMYFKRNAGIVVAGKFTNDVTGLTITTSGGSTPYIYNVTGATFTANQYQDYFFTNGTKYYPVVYNGGSTINSVVGAVSCNTIGHNTTVFNLISGNFIFNSRMSTLNSSVTFQNIDLTSSTGAIRMSTNMILNYKFAKINCTQGNTDVTVNRINFESCQFINSTGSWTNNSAKVQYKGTSLRKSGTKAGIGLVIAQNYCLASTASEGLYMHNWLTAFRFFQGYFTFNLVSTVVIDNCTNGIAVRNGTSLQFSAQVPLYISGVTTLLTNDETMSGNYFVTIASLTGTPTTYAYSGLLTYGYIVPSRNICLSVPGIYGEFETPATATLADNSTGTTQVGDTAQNKSVFIKYTITRGSDQEQGSIWMDNENDVEISIVSEFDDCGVTFSKQISGTVINLNWLTTSTGTAATFRYSIERIMV